MDSDVKVTGGLIIDGTGTPGVRGEIGIRAGKIVALGDAKRSAT